MTVAATSWWHPDRALTTDLDVLASEAVPTRDEHGRPSDDLIDAVAEAYALGGVSVSTAERWLPVWRLFVGWCTDNGVQALPADPRHVAAFILTRHRAGARAATLDITASALRWVHREAGHAGLLERHDAVTGILRRCRSEDGLPTKQAHPVPLEMLGRLLRRDHRRTSHAVRETVLVLSRQLDIPIGVAARAALTREDGVVRVRLGRGHGDRLIAVRGLPHRTPYGRGHPLDAGSQAAALLDLLDLKQVGTLALLISDRDPKHYAHRVARYAGLSATQPFAVADDRVARRVLHAGDHALLRRLRDDALLALMWAAALRADEARRAQARDWLEAEDRDEGVGFIVRSSKTDPTGQGEVVVVPHAEPDSGELDLADVITRWLEFSGLTGDDALFPPMQHDRLDTVKPCASIGPLVRAIDEAGGRIGLEERLSGHSLRRGWVVEAAAQGVTVAERMQHARHRTFEGHGGYCLRDLHGEAGVPQAVLDAVVEAMTD